MWTLCKCHSCPELQSNARTSWDLAEQLIHKIPFHRKILPALGLSKYMIFDHQLQHRFIGQNCRFKFHILRLILLDCDSVPARQLSQQSEDDRKSSRLAVQACSIIYSEREYLVELSQISKISTNSLNGVSL